jgi:endonuclease III related protein
MKCQQIKRSLLEIYQALYESNGRLDWWPGETEFEVCIGAILTQNTAWSNVEKAISNLKREGIVDAKTLLSIPREKITELIKPSGYFNQKAEYLLEFCRFLIKHDLEELKKMEMMEARELILRVKGIGKETADSILLYALDFPIFVIDAYTKRIFSRIGIVDHNIGYYELQEIFHKGLFTDPCLFNDYHAQIVILGKEHCNKKPKCSGCALRKTNICHYSM